MRISTVDRGQASRGVPLPPTQQYNICHPERGRGTSNFRERSEENRIDRKTK
jgi:hypothetical protein